MLAGTVMVRRFPVGWSAAHDTWRAEPPLGEAGQSRADRRATVSASPCERATEHEDARRAAAICARASPSRARASVSRRSRATGRAAVASISLISMTCSSAASTRLASSAVCLAQLLRSGASRLRAAAANRDFRFRAEPRSVPFLPLSFQGDELALLQLELPGRSPRSRRAAGRSDCPSGSQIDGGGEPRPRLSRARLRGRFGRLAARPSAAARFRAPPQERGASSRPQRLGGLRLARARSASSRSIVARLFGAARTFGLEVARRDAERGHRRVAGPGRPRAA